MYWPPPEAKLPQTQTHACGVGVLRNEPGLAGFDIRQVHLRSLRRLGCLTFGARLRVLAGWLSIRSAALA